MKLSNNYDVIVIGGGISGLVAANYLAKAGKQVLLLEQYNRVGGCCSSFERNGYFFDVGVHYFGSMSQGGALKTIFDELELNEKIKFSRINPSDVLIIPDGKIRIYNEIKRTIAEFSSHFPDEANNIDKFFRWVVNTSPAKLYIELNVISFRYLLDKYFENNKLKQTLSILLGNIGLPSHKASAITAVILFRAYILDGGYYPVGGVQVFPDILEENFKSLGGSINVGVSIKNIVLSNNKAIGVTFPDGSLIKSRYIISAIDASYTLKKLIGEDILPNEIRNKLNTFIPSISAVVVYLGLNRKVKGDFADHCSHWVSPNYCVDEFYDNIYGGNITSDNLHCLISCASFHDSSRAPANGETISIFTGAPYMGSEYWNINKSKYANKMIDIVEQFVPDIRDTICVQEIATPVTINNFTNNTRGALFGWASTVEQIKKSNFPIHCSFISNLYHVGHWATQGYAQGGIPVVALAGRHAANSILSHRSHHKIMVLK